MTRLKKEIIDNPLYIEFCESNESAILKFCSSFDSLIEELIENNNISKNRVEELVILVDSANAAFANYNKKEILEIILKLKSLAGLSKKNRNEDEKILSSAKRLIEKLKKETPKIFHEIEKSDVLLCELTTKEVGVGIEMGHAHALGKPIIGIRKIGSEPSTTMEGILSLPVLEYQNEAELALVINPLLDQVKKMRFLRITKEHKS